MEPSKTHGTALPQQALTRPAGGCPSGPRPEDLMLGGHEGANPHVGQREAATTSNDQSLNTDPITLTKLEMYTILVEKARLRSSKCRPLDIDAKERTMIVLNALYPNGIPPNIDSQDQNFNAKISTFVSKCEKLYNESARNLKRFCKKNKKWLATIFDVQIPKENMDESTEKKLPENTKEQYAKPVIDLSIETSEKIIIEPKPGTSFEVQHSETTSYEDLSDRQKRRARKRLQESLEDEPPQKLLKVLSKIVTDESGEKLNKSAARDFELVVNECLKSPTRSVKIASTIKSRAQHVEPKPYTPEEALCHIIDRKLTVEDYTITQKDLKERGYPAYPPYYKVHMAKQMCYPEEEIRVTEREASVSLQGLLLHTFRRIIKFCSDNISKYCRQNKKDQVSCTFQGSWGFDGSTGQSFYKQAFTEGENQNENCLFATTYIPLYLKTSDGFVLWSNPSPQSFRYCRPLKIQYRAENKELILEEKLRVEDEIKTLTPLYAETDEGQVVIADSQLHLTIIDGKVFNVITGTTSQQRCACCGATSAQFNNLDLINNKPVNPETLRYGLSPLHAWIRIFEFLLHLGYKNDPAVRKWRVSKNSPEARIVEERKKTIQGKIRDKMSLLVDVVRPNSGTTNDGNTARTALSDQYRETFAEILDLESWLVNDLHTILVALSSGLMIDGEKFDQLSKSIATRYVQTYSWYYMPVTVHKILIHGKQIIESCPLPIGMLSEQAGESRNKYWRYDRQHHTRKLDRKTTILDLFHRALESSDPYITSSSLNARQKQKQTLPKKVLNILKVTTENVRYYEVERDHDRVDDEDSLCLTTEETLIQSDNEDDL